MVAVVRDQSSPLDACDALVARAPEAYESYRCYFDVGGREGLLDEAARRLDAPLRAGRSPGLTLLARALVAGERGEPADRQRALYERSAGLLEAAGDARPAVIARTNIGRLLIEEGDAAGAREQVARARETAALGTDAEAKLRAAVFEAVQLVHFGEELGRAQRTLLAADAALAAEGPRGLQLTALQALANASAQLGRHQEAILHLRRLLELRLAAGQRAAVPRLRFNIANARQAQAEEEESGAEAVDELRDLARAALASAREHGDAVTEAYAEALLSDLWRNADAETARQHVRRCARVARSVRREDASIRCLGSDATLLAARDPRAAERALDEAEALARAAGRDVMKAYVAQVRLRTAWSSRTGSAAARASLAALDAMEQLRAGQAEASARMGLVRQWTGDYRWLAGRLLEGPEPHVARAFEVSERMRARVLQERLAAGGDGHGRETSAVGVAIAAAQRRLLDPALAPATREELLTRLRALELQEETVSARAVAGLSTVPPIALAEAQRRLAPDEILLLYFVDRDHDLLGDPAGGSWLVAIARDGVTVRRLPDRLALEAAVPMFVGMLEARDGAEAAAAVALHGQLVGDAIGPAVRRVIVVPDGVLHALPFAALRAAPDDAPLGVRLEISAVPSVSLWARWKGLPAPQAGQGALVVASPVLPHASATADAVRGGVLAQGLALGPLAHARREGARSRRAIGRDSRLLAGERASEAALKRTDLRPFALLHFATHAVADDAFPDRSAVVLAAGSEDEDGLLQPREIAALGLEGRAVVLSACQTAAGAYVGGEGVLSLARSFFEAGARTVVAGLWRLRDDEAERLMRDLYEGLARGDTVGESLRAARARAVAEGAPAAAWAGVVVLGDQDFALPPAPFAWWRVAAVLLPLAVAGTALWLARRG